MSGFLESLYLSEIVTQCRFVTIANRQLGQASARRELTAAAMAVPPTERPPGADQPDLMACITEEFAAIQSILSAAGNLSKILWGASDIVAGERRDLRDRLEVTDKSPLRSKSVRNSFEHFDERIAEWYGKTPVKHFSSRNVGTIPTDRNTVFGHYDPNTGEVVFQARSVSIPEIVAEVERLLPLAEREFFG